MVDKIKFTPKKDKATRAAVKPASIEADALDEIEKGLPEHLRAGKPTGTIKIQDDVDSGKITPIEAAKLAKIGKGKVLEPVKDFDKLKAKETATKRSAGTKPPSKKKVKKIAKQTLKDGHTYIGDEKDAVCINCGLSRDNTTTECFRIKVFPATLIKFNMGLVDFKGGMWITLPQDSKE